MAILDKIEYPKDIKELDYNSLNKLSSEIRDFLVENVSKTGGHLASNLGVVEITIALHKVFNMPKDKIVWDVGHQSYVHKILTGRKNDFDTLRKYNGLSGFPKPSESEFDTFAAGHSSTSISAALGIAKSRDIKGENFDVVAVIGDGALTGGMAFEALNDAGMSNTNLIVILNDNEMSISQNVGGMSRYLSKIRTEPFYINFRDDVEEFVKRIPAVGNNLYRRAYRFKESLKQLLLQGMLFEEFGFTYLGPIDGHNIKEIVDVLIRAKKIKGPVIIHAVTKKGKGYKFAELSPDVFHGIGPFDIETGEKLGGKKETYSHAFSEEIVKIAKENKNIVGITAAMPDGTGLSKFAEKFPERFFDVGIAEQHAVTFAAGMASNGLKPVFAVYSTFLQRAYDQIVHDVCMQNLPVMFAIDRAGIVGADGETHQGLLDISYLRSVPNMTIITPKDILEMKIMLEWCFRFDKPLAIRYPRGGDLDVSFDTYKEIRYGEWEVINEGNDIAVLAAGKMVQHSYCAIKELKETELNVELINCRFIKPLDENMLENVFKKFNTIITVEDNYINGGFGSYILQYAAKSQYKGKIINLGFPDEYIPHGSCDLLYEKYGLDINGIKEEILKSI